MKPAIRSREKRAALCSPLLFYIIIGIIVAAFALFLIFHPKSTGNDNSGPKTISSAQQNPTQKGWPQIDEGRIFAVLGCSVCLRTTNSCRADGSLLPGLPPVQVLRSSNDRQEPLSNRCEAYAESRRCNSERRAIRKVSFRLPDGGGRQASRRTRGMDRTQDDLSFLLGSAIRQNPLA